MLIDSLLRQDPEEVFLFLERKVNCKFPLSPEYAKVSEYFRADLGVPSFSLPFIFLARDKTELYEASPSSDIEKQILNEEKIKFCVHPEMIDSYLTRGMYKLTEFEGNIKVSPTSSTRTVFTRNSNGNFMMKVDLEKRLGNRIRKMKRRHVEHSNRITKELMESNLPEYFAYMPESIGVLYVQGENEVGMIVREFERRPLVSEKRYLLPFFSLFSLDKEDKGRAPLLAQIVERTAEEGKEYDFFHERILKPFISSWAYFVVKRGLSPDIHSQNCLLEINYEGMPKRIVYRDFQEFFINPEIRKARGLSLDFKNNVIARNDSVPKNVNGKFITDVEESKRIGYSVVYDYTIGTILDYFSIVLSKFPSCNESRVVDGAKSIFKECFNGMQDELFPKSAYHLKQQQQDISKMYEIEEAKPKYR